MANLVGTVYHFNVRHIWLLLVLWTWLWPTPVRVVRDVEPRADQAQQRERAAFLCRDSVSKPSTVTHREPFQPVLTSLVDLAVVDSARVPPPTEANRTAQGFDPAIALDTFTARGPPLAQG